MSHWTKTKDGKEILQTRKMARAALEFDEFHMNLRKKHKLSLWDMYALMQGSASIFLSELLKRVKK
jgi:hypothetical protein